MADKTDTKVTLQQLFLNNSFMSLQDTYQKGE